MKKSKTSQHGHENTCSLDDDSTHSGMAQEIKVEDEYDEAVLEEQSLIAVTTIAAITTDTHEVVSLPLEVLGIVLKNLEQMDLLECRRVNSLWRCSTRSILLGRDVYGIQFYHWTESKETFLSRIQSFNECLKNAKRLDCLEQFPCTRFEFVETSLDENVIQRFFILYGPFIKSLSLKCCSTSAKKNGQLQVPFRLLTRDAPNIEELYMSKMYIDYSSKRPETLFPKSQNGINNFKLPQLKKLVAKFSYPFGDMENTIVEEILEAADNLERYEIAKLYEGILDKLASLNKVHVIKKVKIHFSLEMELLEKFANLNPNLKCIRLDMDDLYFYSNDLKLMERGERVLQKILESSRNSLEIIEKLPIGFLPGFQMPVLSQVKKINISNTIDLESFILESIFHHRGLCLSKVFPNVQKVELFAIPLSHDEATVYWDTFFPHIDLLSNTWPSVTSLQIQFLLPNAADKISRQFPNLKQLVVVAVPNLPMTCRGIFASLKQLESLQFVSVKGDCDANKFPAMDSAFSGFSHETCIRLASSEETVDDVEVEKLRENLSILELKSLKSLKIATVGYSGSLILSRVSGIFAFQRMPQLKVTVDTRRDGKYD